MRPVARRIAAGTALTRIFHPSLTAITWLQEFVELGRDKMMPYAASVLGAILPCLSHPEDRIAHVALRCAPLKTRCEGSRVLTLAGIATGQTTRCLRCTRRLGMGLT